MTQLEGAVGGANDDPVVAAEPTIEDRLGAALESQPAEERADPPEPEEQEEAPQGADDEPSVDDIDEPEAEDPPIAPPVSWTDEEKAIFGQLPPDAQKAVARREAEREKFVQQKSQEAAQTRQKVEAEALQAIQTVQQQNAQAFESLLVQVPQKPTQQQLADDPYTYAPLMDSYDNAVAHNQWVEQQVSKARQQAQQAEQVLIGQRRQETAAVLQEQFPEFLDATKGAEIRQTLASTATALGIPADMQNDLHHVEILALKTASDWKAKAEKYDTLMAKKMERVREAKTLPKVSRPGVPQGKDAVANQRYQADRQAMRSGDTEAAKRVFSRFI